MDWLEEDQKDHLPQESEVLKARRISFFHRSSCTLAFLLALFLAMSCSSVRTKKEFYGPIRNNLGQEQYVEAASKMEAEGRKFSKKDRLLYYLDAGFAWHYAGEYDSSNARLIKAEQAAEELFTKSVTRAAGSLLLNDNLLNYSGEDYEILYANLIMALNYLAEDQFDQAFVEVRRANEKLAQMKEKYGEVAEIMNSDSSKVSGQLKYELPEPGFHDDAFARYLSMHMYAADGSYDDARIDLDALRLAFATQPQVYSFEIPAVRYHSDSLAILSVVAMSGIGPTKEGLSLRIRADKDLDLVQVLYDGPDSSDVEYGHFPIKVSEDFYFKFQLPVIKTWPGSVASIEVSIDGKVVGNLSIIEDISAVAQETFRVRKTLIYIKSVSRAIAKGLAAFKAKKKADTGGVGGWLKKLAVDAVVDLSEAADLRCSRLLPRFIWVGDFEVPPGRHDVRVEFKTAEGRRINSKLYPELAIRKNDFNLVEAFTLN